MAEADEPGERQHWRGWLVNRFTITAAVLAAITIGWNLYVSRHDRGLVRGLVVDTHGNPVAGAEVVLWIYNFTTFQEDRHAMSGADGRFTIVGNPSHRIQIMARKAGEGATERRPIRLYFRSEDYTLKHPLVLPGA